MRNPKIHIWSSQSCSCQYCPVGGHVSVLRQRLCNSLGPYSGEGIWQGPLLLPHLCTHYTSITTCIFDIYINWDMGIAGKGENDMNPHRNVFHINQFPFHGNLRFSYQCKKQNFCQGHKNIFHQAWYSFYQYSLYCIVLKRRKYVIACMLACVFLRWQGSIYGLHRRQLVCFRSLSKSHPCAIAQIWQQISKNLVLHFIALFYPNIIYVV